MSIDELFIANLPLNDLQNYNIIKVCLELIRSLYEKMYDFIFRFLNVHVWINGMRHQVVRL